MSEREIDNMRKIENRRHQNSSAAPLNMFVGYLVFYFLTQRLGNHRNGISSGRTVGDELFQRILAPSTCDRGVCANIENPRPPDRFRWIETRDDEALALRLPESIDQTRIGNAVRRSEDPPSSPFEST